ncbi:MAG: hypothetical protein AAGE59_22700 [Cyanobacteria bacterium P01_F01_bin.86]
MDINHLGSSRSDLRLALNRFDPLLLESLEAWQKLGLISEVQLRDFCATSLSCTVFASLPIQSSHPDLLRGMDLLLSQGVLSQEQVLSWCQANLSESLPVVDMVPTPAAKSSQPSVKPKDWVPTILQSLMDEISVLWLLFLGVFLVVVSSAVLAASQWDMVSAAGQYGILWTYTFLFWLVSHWLGRREELQLTANTLKLTALLIMPVNFWMIDAFQLVQRGLGLLVALVAGVILSVLMAYTLRPREGGCWGWLTFVNLLLLSWLHWNWQDAWMPPVTIYVGVIATGFCTIFATSETLDIVRPRPPNQYSFEQLLALTPLYATLLLLLRGIWITQLPLSSLSLAFGLVGTIFCCIGRRPALGAQSWWLVGGACLGFGRLVSLEFDSHGQAVLITGLTLWVLSDRLLRLWQPWLAWLIFFTGLQGLYPLYALIPLPVQTSILDWLASVAGAEGLRPAVVSLLVLPYWWMTLWAMGSIRQRQIASIMEQMALGLGGLLTILTLENSCLRLIFLVGVGLPLWLRLGRQPSALLLGLLHSLTLGAIASGVDYFVPNLALMHWAGLCVVAMTVEFFLSVFAPWKWGSWWFGLTLALVGYLCFWTISPYSDGVGLEVSPIEIMTVWLIPLGFTALGYVQVFPQKLAAQRLGLGSIFMVQLLCLSDSGTRLVGFGFALLLTAGLSSVMRRFFPAVVTIGWAVVLGIDAFGTYIPADFRNWFWVFFPGLSLVLAVLSWWLCRLRLGLAALYRRAIFDWSYWLTFLLTGALSLVALVELADPGILVLPMQIGALLTAIAACYQFWLRPRSIRLYLSAIAIETAIILLSWLSASPRDLMAMGTLAAGFGALLFRSLCRGYPRIAPRNWSILPLMCAGLGVLLGHYDFLTYTGLYTLGAALIFTLVGRLQRGQGVTYLGIAGFSFGVYELLIYQVLQAEGDYAGDALVIFAGVATLLAIGDRMLAKGLTRVLRLSPTQFLPVAHLHWLASSLFLSTALIVPMRPWAEAIWIILTLTLAAYAMVAGRIQTGFLYAGVAQGLGAIAFGMAQVIPLSVLGTWGGAIAVIFAAGLYYFPWNRYGWEPLPEQKMAMLLPAGIATLSLPEIGLSSLLCVGAWYFWVSLKPDFVRLSYLGLAFGNWAVFRLLERWSSVTPMWMAMMFGCSLLLVVQWEPLLQNSARREVRHWLRCLALGLMSLVALFESDGYLGWSLVTVLMGLLLGASGLVLRLRSFLYVGTLLFFVKVLWLLWAFVSDYSFLLWALGIALGIVLIWIGATFESRRTQAIALLDYWVDTFQNWQ